MVPLPLPYEKVGRNWWEAATEHGGEENLRAAIAAGDAVQVKDPETGRLKIYTGRATPPTASITHVVA